MRGSFVHPFDDDDFISGTERSASRSSRTCQTWTPSSRRSAAAACSTGIGVAAESAAARGARLRGGAGNGGAAVRLVPRRDGQPLRRVAGVVRRRRRRKVGAARACGRCCGRASTTRSSSALDEAARAMRLGRRPRARHRRRRRRLRGRRRAARTRWPRAATGKWWPSSRAATSIWRASRARRLVQ